MNEQQLARKAKATNLILNGTFDNGATGWNADGATFENQRCNLPERTPNTFASHVTPIRVEPGALYVVTATAFSTYIRGGRIQLIHAGGSQDAYVLIGGQQYELQTTFRIPIDVNSVEFRLWGGATGVVWFDNVTMVLVEESEELLKNHSFTDHGEHWIASNPSYDGDACIFSSAPLFVSQTIDSAGAGTYTLKVDVETEPFQTGRIVVLADGVEVHTRELNGPGQDESTFAVAANVTNIEVRLMRTASGSIEFKFNSVSLKRSG